MLSMVLNVVAVFSAVFLAFVLSLTLLLLNSSCPVLANTLDPDQLASEEAN